MKSLPHHFKLVRTSSGLELHQIDSKIGPLKIDFLAGSLKHRLKQLRGRNELIARAVGWKPNSELKIIDATAGLGRDGFLLACLGCDVLMLERSAIMGELLQDGLQRALADPAFAHLNIKLVIVDAKNYLLQLSAEVYPDVIYLDPMYPHRIKSALVKKEMRYLRELVGDDADADELLQTALTRAKQRVVVKRPAFAPPLSADKLHHSLEGENTRFDVYSEYK